MTSLIDEKLTGQIIGAFFGVYNALGYGFLEAVYCRALAGDLKDLGLDVEQEAAVEVFYKGEVIGYYRTDLLVEGRLVVEVKATQLLHPSAERQLLNYVRASRSEVGLLLHFGPKAMFKRVVRSPFPAADAKA